MKTEYFVLIGLVLGIFTNCTPEAEGRFFVAKPEIWSLTHVSRGIAGVDDNFDKGVITWTLHINDSVLTIKNDHEGNNLYNGPKSGNYPYSIKTIADGKTFLVIGGGEFGELTLSEKRSHNRSKYFFRRYRCRWFHFDI